jgi:hypothetical protein
MVSKSFGGNLSITNYKNRGPIMTQILRSLFGYWEVWHVVLATWLFMWIYFARFPMNYLWKLIGRIPFKQLTFLIVIAIAILWEILEAQWNLKSYPNFRAFLLNSYKDLLAALVGSVVSIFMIPEKRI